MRQKTPAMPDITFDPFSASGAALLGLIPENASVPEVMRQMQKTFSLPSLKERLQTIDGSSLLAKYKDAGQITPTFVPLIVGIFNEFLFPLAKQFQEKRGQDTMTLPTNIDMQKMQEYMQVESERFITSNRGIGILRLYLTVLLAVLPSDEEVLVQWATTLLGIMSNVSEYLGFPPSIITNLLKTSKKNNPDVPVSRN